MASRRIRSFVAILRSAGDRRQNGSFRPDPLWQDRQEVPVFQLLAVKEKQQAGDARAAPRERPGGSTPFMRMHSGRTAYPPPPPGPREGAGPDPGGIARVVVQPVTRRQILGLERPATDLGSVWCGDGLPLNPPGIAAHQTADRGLPDAVRDPGPRAGAWHPRRLYPAV